MTNVEIKATYVRTAKTDKVLEKIGARLEGVEDQVDTYFDVDSGRLKIRERNTDIPQLIQYFREDKKGPRPSYYEIVHLRNAEKVKEALTREHGVRVVVEKKREIWVWENVRIHFDRVQNLGEFLELEAVVEKEGDKSEGQKKIRWLMDKFGIKTEHLIGQSYSDLLVSKKD